MVVEFVIHLLRRPVHAGLVLHPFEVAHRDVAGVAEDGGEHFDAALHGGGGAGVGNVGLGLGLGMGAGGRLSAARGWGW